MNAVLELNPSESTLILPADPLAGLHAEAFKRWMESLLGDVQHIVLDLSRVDFMDSAGCGVLLWLHMQLRERGARLTVVGVTPQVRALFELLRLPRVLQLRESA